MSSTALEIVEIDGVKAVQRVFIQKLFETELGIPVRETVTLARCNDNYIHFVTFTSALASNKAISDKPGTNVIPSGTVKAVFRIGNPDSMFNHAFKVDNTVAVMELMRRALSKLDIQHMPGAEIEADFHKKLSRESQRQVLGQVAQVLKTVQDFKLPAAASGFGGLAFDQDGDVISVPFVVEPYTSPFTDMKSFYRGMLQAQLKEADRSLVAKGWHEDGLRDRLDVFAEKDLESILSKVLSKDVEPRLIIGDVIVGNFLFDPSTFNVLDLVDYDSYFDSQSPQWEVMKIFEEELERVGVARPSSTEVAESIAEVYGFITEVCPFLFIMERWVKNQTEEKL
ncbi:hypothetical protein BX600DRAFT_511862 [Xylariales sp. PMI_506]|nr:hypothetical protein BX600DRAFT_511862 [Xylariales sp. PMI_506]